MRKMNGKRFILGLMALMMCLTMCAPAFASTGDRILVHETSMDGFLPTTVRAVVPSENGFVIVKSNESEVIIEKYADVKAEPEIFVLDEEAQRTEDSSFYIYPWFSWKGELYGFENKTIYTGEGSSSLVFLQHVKLENGEVILEESGLPELDLSGVMEGEEGEEFFSYASASFVMDDKLFLGVYGEEETYLLEMIDLADGSCSEIEISGELEEVAPGPEGTVLIVRWEWDADTSTNTVKVSGLDLKSQEEKEIGVFTGLENANVNPCYDRKTDTLYIIKDGELWAVPQFDVERMEAVNDCPNIGEGVIMLPEGFVLIWSVDNVMIKNTDPSQRGSISLRVSDRGFGSAMTETVYDMNNKRGDISVVVRPEWGKRTDIVQAMLYRDGSTDVYTLPMDENEFMALRNRGYLPDLSSNEKIVESTSRLYPYIQEAVKQDGKIIGVPVCFDGRTIGIHMEAWKEIGGTEEELPKTWSQFFDWLETLPERLEGRDISVISSWESRDSFRAEILEAMLNQYEVWMEKKGETDYYFAAPELCELVRRLDGLDYAALQIRVSDDEDGDGYFDDYDEKIALLDNLTSMLFYDGSAYCPMALSFSEDEEPVMPIEVSVAFMNPFSEHPQEAMEFLALAADNLYGLDQYAAYTDRTEPLHYSGYESEQKFYQERIENLKKQIEAAENGDDREMLTQFLQNAEEELEYSEKTSWIVSREQIERYQQWQKYFKAKEYSFLNVLYASADEEEDSDEYTRLFYDSYGMKPEELLGALDKKIRMMRMEGN